MSTRLSLYCNRFLEAGWLVALVVIPLHFNTYSSRTFEPDKIALLRSIAVMMALAWMIKAGEAGLIRLPGRAAAFLSEPRSSSPGRRLVVHPIVVLVILSLASYGLASGLSILPRISLWGYFERLHGLYTLAAYLLFFFSILALVRTRAQQQRLITAVLLASIPIALYGILQHFSLDPLAWDRPVHERAQATMGNPVFLAAALSMAVPLTLYRLIETARQRRFFLPGCYLLLLVLQLVCIVFTQSRGPVLGLMAGLFFGGLLWTLTRRQWRAARIIVGLSIACAAIVAIVNLPNSPLSFTRDVPYLNRLLYVADVEGSSEGRMLIWEGAVDLIAANPKRIVVGYGPETIRFAYAPYYSAELGRSHGWDLFVDRLHNETLDVLVTTGLIGFLLYLLLFTSIVYYGLTWLGLLTSSRQRKGFLALWASGGVGALLAFQGIGQTWAFSGIALPFGMLGGLFLYLAGYAFFRPLRDDQGDAPSSPRGYALLLILLFSALLAHFVESNVGLAFSATRLLFWAYTALFIVLGTFSGSLPESTAKAPASPRPLRGSLPVMSQSVGLLLLSMAYSFSAAGETPENTFRIGLLLAATWILAGLLLVRVTPSTDGKPRFLPTLGVYTGLSLLPLVLLLPLHGGGLGEAPHHLVLYYLIVLLLVASSGLLLGPEAVSASRKASPSGIVLASAGFLAAVLLIHSTNIQKIQANIYHRKALLAFQQRHYDPALAAYRRALELDPGQEAYHLELAQLLAAKAYYQTVIPAERDQLFREAEAVIKQAAANNPYEQNHPAVLAEVYRFWAGKTTAPQRRAERYEQAFTAFDEALHLNRENVLSLRKWAETYLESGDPLRALDKYRQVLAWDSTDASLYMQIGALYQAEEKWALAAEMYEGARRHSKPSPEVFEALAIVYQRLGRCDKALEQMRRALRRWPDDVRFEVRADLLTRQCAARQSGTG